MREKKITSRKFWLAVVIASIATALIIIPNCLGLVPFLSGSEYVTLILGVFGIYTTGNVAERHVSNGQADDVVHLLTNKKPFLDEQIMRALKLK